MRLIGLLAAVFAALAGCATTAEPPAGPIFYVVRHLHTPAGERDPDLTEEGQRQATLLAGWFRRRAPRILYVSHFRRAQQTAAPLAAKLGLTPIVYDPADSPAIVARVKAGPVPALIVGHSNTVPDIVEQLGGSRPDPLVHEDFGDIWQITADGSTQRLRISEPQPR